MKNGVMRNNRPFAASRTWLAVTVVALLAGASPAGAVIEGSPHDLIPQSYDTLKLTLSQDRCSRCHIASSVGQNSFLPALPPSLASAWTASSVGCFSCHDGTTIVSPAVDASLTAFHPDAHGHGLAGDEGQTPGADGEPAELGGLGGNVKDCTSCHDPHDNSRRPFLRVEIAKICLFCHSALAEAGRGKDNATGNHLLPGDQSLLALPEAPIQIDSAFRVAFPSPYPLQGGKFAVGTHWDLGGHLAEGAEGNVSCISCHAIHGDEQTPPLPDLLALDPVRDVADLFCEGCHVGQRGDGKISDAHPNPGGTTTGRTYHPVDDDIANKAGHIVEVKIPTGWPIGKGEPGRLLCSTCHVAHQARPATALLRPAVTAPTFCENCHVTMPLSYHHPVGTTGGDCLPTVPKPEGAVEPGVYCEHCHRAHNAGLGSAVEAGFAPLLRYDLNKTEGCSVCHPAANPTCESRAEKRASHFVGDPTLAETYASTAPPLRIEPWPESGKASRYGGERQQAVLCLSCHVFREGAVLSGDAKRNRFLLARSGNGVEWVPGEATAYLCTGCHGEVPGTGEGSKGHTHPLMNGDIAKLGRDPELPVTGTPNGMVNCDSCHRPHEALTAGGYYILESVTGPETNAATIHPQIDFTVLCHSCHDPGKY